MVTMECYSTYVHFFIIYLHWNGDVGLICMHRPFATAFICTGHTFDVQDDTPIPKSDGVVTSNTKAINASRLEVNDSF